MYGKKLAISRKYTFIHEIKIAIPRPIKRAIAITGMAQNICHEKGKPSKERMIRKTAKVGTNLKSAITNAEIGNIIRGKAVFNISRCPAVIDLTPPLRLLLTK